jgi:hypothetical protein
MVGVARHIVLPFNPLKTLGFKPQLLPRTEGFYVYNILKFINALRTAVSEELKVHRLQ